MTNALRNVGTAVGSYLVFVGCAFVVRTAFVQSLDVEYLGLNGLFSTLANAMGAAEMGIGAAISFRLYGTLSRGQTAGSARYFRFLRKVNLGLALGILVLGLLSVPVIGFFLQDVREIDEGVGALFVLYLAATVVTYAFAHYGALLVADQREYVVALNLAGLMILVSALQVLVLLQGHGYVAYLALQALLPLLQGVVLWLLVRRRYPWAADASVERLEPADTAEVWRDVRALAIFRVAGIVNASAPVLWMSSLFGLAVLGVFSNYYLIVHAAQSAVRKVFAALTPSLGALNAVAGTRSKHEAYRALVFAGVVLFGASASGLHAGLDAFVQAWIGSRFVLEGTATLWLCLVFFLQGVTRVSNVFRDAFGLFRQGQLRPAVLAGLVVVLSLTGGQLFGLPGLLAGWALAYVLMPLWFDPLVVHRHALHAPVGPFFLRWAGWVATVVVTYLALARVVRVDVPLGLLGPLLEIGLTTAAVGLVTVLLWWRSAECRWLRRRLRR
ncbi:lipopolysaccharide biosynthesis protein [Ornithinimicrobium pekingense]|uniref:Polysaccharide biosynthesis protein n=1 Tax=Ornithinimicrobium pekingense TaxID=384677 RepID=A0ABQ2F8V1_9MICO|nr:hypothetical protein [Ornithinimicrobium pekingense]GGK71090.1 hypothetical protein GCM10011509_19400 [Ornithinimicrobium pekingense]